MHYVLLFHTKVGPVRFLKIDWLKKKDQKARLLYLETDAARGSISHDYYTDRDLQSKVTQQIKAFDCSSHQEKATTKP